MIDRGEETTTLRCSRPWWRRGEVFDVAVDIDIDAHLGASAVVDVNRYSWLTSKYLPCRHRYENE